MTKTELHAKTKDAINAIDSIHKTVLYSETAAYIEIATALECLKMAEQKLETEAEEEQALRLTEYRDGCLMSTH